MKVNSLRVISSSTGSFPLAALGLLMLSAMVPKTGIAQSLDHDKTLPIEISADSLEVAQEEHVATFAGNVDAVQGDLVLSAKTLKVHYEGKGRGSTVGLAAGTGSTISKIEALGGVILASPDETAEGEIGIYDVPAQLITLEGSVVLTRGENVLHGERLVLNLATGKSHMVGTTATATADGSKTPNGRVKALFTPKQKSNTKESDADASTPPTPAARPK